jgi:hypothetical protein
MGAVVTVLKRGVIFDTNGDLSLQEEFDTVVSLLSVYSCVSFNIAHKTDRGQELPYDVIIWNDHAKPNREIHYSKIEKIIDIDGIERTGTDIDSNRKVFDYIVKCLDN